MSIATRFPPLYECSACGASVKVTAQPTGEPIKEFRCEHTQAIIYANRKVDLYGRGSLEAMSAPKRAAIHLKLTVRQFLSWVTGRSI